MVVGARHRRCPGFFGSLAEPRGYYVYLVEKSPAIGGRMAQLDKTFPTNDCAMCIVSPKLVDVRPAPEHRDHHQRPGGGHRRRARATSR